MMAEDFESFMQRLFEFISEKSAAESQNPEDYDRSIEILDDDCLLLLAEIHSKQKETTGLLEQARLKQSEREVALNKMKIRLKQKYPAIPGDDEVSHSYYLGWRKWKGKYYFVSKDSDEKEKN